MSYDLYIWDSSRHLPDPATLEDAARTTVALENARDGVNPKFIEFAHKLVARYPSRDMYPEGDPDAHDSPWLGNPVEQARKHEDALFSLSLPTDDRVRLTRFVVDAANESGLAVYDDQLGMAFLPSGRVLPADKTALWAKLKHEQDAAPAPVTKAQLRKVVWSLLKVRLAKHGFTEGKGLIPERAFVRTFDGVGQYVTMDTGGESPDFTCYVYLFVHQERIQAISSRLFGINPNRLQTFGVPLGHFVGRPNDGIPVRSSAELDNVLSLLETQGLEILDVAKDLKGIDAVMNRAASKELQEYFSVNYLLNRLIAARLSGNPDFEALVAQFDKHTQKLRDGTREKYLKLVAHLRQQSTDLG